MLQPLTPGWISVGDLKILSFVITFSVALVACAAPQYLARRGGGGVGGNKYVSWGNTFSAGVFLAMGLIHLLPEAGRGFEKEYGVTWTNKFRPDFLLCIIGYSAVMTVQRVVFPTPTCPSQVHSVDHCHAPHSHGGDFYSGAEECGAAAEEENEKRRLLGSSNNNNNTAVTPQGKLVGNYGSTLSKSFNQSPSMDTLHHLGGHSVARGVGGGGIAAGELVGNSYQDSSDGGGVSPAGSGHYSRGATPVVLRGGADGAQHVDIGKKVTTSGDNSMKMERTGSSGNPCCDPVEGHHHGALCPSGIAHSRVGSRGDEVEDNDNNSAGAAGHSHKDHHLLLRTSERLPPAALTRSYVLMLALSLHSFTEGMALGLQDRRNDVLMMLVAIASHKWAESFALGASFLATGSPRHIIIRFSLVFALSTPIGILLGWMAHTLLPPSASAIFKALSAGTFLYIGASEVVVEEFVQGKQYWAKWTFFIIGLSVMYAATVVMG